MATYTAQAGQIAVHDKQLVANTADTVTFTDTVERVEVLADGTAAIYARVDGGTPTVSGPNAFKLPAGAVNGLVLFLAPGHGTVQLVSAGTPVYSVVRADAY